MNEPFERELAVFSAARRLPTAERAAYLDQTCAEDAAAILHFNLATADGRSRKCYLRRAIARRPKRSCAMPCRPLSKPPAIFPPNRFSGRS